MIGSAIAWRLAEAGSSVCVLERGDLGAETSSAAAGMLAPQGELVEPPAFAELCFHSLALYPKFLSEIESLTGKDLGFRRDGTMLVGIEEAECHELEEIYEVQTGRGLRLERLSGEEVRRRAPGLAPAIQMGLWVEGDCWLNNEFLMQGVVKACCRRGVELRAHSEVTRLEVRNGRVEALEYRSDEGKTVALSAGHYVLAAGAWSAPLAASAGIHAPVAPCRGQMMEFETPPELSCVVRCGHHYLVPRSAGHIVVGTTAEFNQPDKDVTAGGLLSILEGVMRFAPLVKELRFRRAWAGLRPDTPDHLPLLGYGPVANLVFATGHFRNGILLAPATAEVVVDLVRKGSSAMTLEPFTPTRFAA